MGDPCVLQDSPLDRGSAATAAGVNKGTRRSIGSLGRLLVLEVAQECGILEKQSFVQQYAQRPAVLVGHPTPTLL